jgi:hypothetical protein
MSCVLTAETHLSRCETPWCLGFLMVFVQREVRWKMCGEAHPIQAELQEHGDDGHVKDAVLNCASVLHVAQGGGGRDQGGPVCMRIPTTPMPMTSDALHSICYC